MPTPLEKANDFLTNATQFRLGALLTETPHPRSKTLSDIVREDIASGLNVIFDVDTDIVEKYKTVLESGLIDKAADAMLKALRNGKKVFCTGCGATGRLSIQMDSIWRDYWQKRRAKGLTSPDPDQFEDRTFSVMAGGDYALIKSVEGFEDFTQFGRKQIGDLDVENGDVVFAITEGGETSFVIGTAWQGVDVGADVFFVYNNPDDVLCEKVVRSREVIEDPRITKINLTSGPMAITGSTRMQATSIELCTMLTIWEIVIQKLTGGSLPVKDVFLSVLKQTHSALRSPAFLQELAALLKMEEKVYSTRHKNTYFADALGIDVLTDTTERSPTFCIPAFRKYDDDQAAESWSFLFLPEDLSEQAWSRLLKRTPRAVEWSLDDVEKLVGADLAPRQHEIMRTIGLKDIYRFKIGLDGQPYRPFNTDDSATAIVTADELNELLSVEGYYHQQLHRARQDGAKTGVIFIGDKESTGLARSFVNDQMPETTGVFLEVPATESELHFASRIGVKLMLNALSTCTMVRLGRVMGNVMIWVVPSNLKLIDRSTRYISQLAEVDYDTACRMLFEVIEFVTPRMKAGQTYPAPVGVSVMRLRHGLTNEQAEERLYKELA